MKNKTKDQKGSITIFVLIGLLFMSSFSIISLTSNINKAKILKEQFNIISGIYNPNDDDDTTYTETYENLRQKTKQTKTINSIQYSDDTAKLEIEDSYGESLVNYRVYGSGTTPILPQEYQEVEYIEGTGTQYIDTNLGVVANTIDTLVFEVTNSAPGYFFGCIKEDNVNLRWMLSALSLDTFKGFCKTNGTGDILPKKTISIGKKYTVIFPNTTNGIVTIDGQLWSTTARATVSWASYTICLFAQHYTGDVIRYGSAKIYEYKRTNVDNEIIADFIPCYCRSDGEIGMYNLSEGKFYTNLGTGDFLKGKNISTCIGDLVEDTSDANYGKYLIPIKVSNEDGDNTIYNIYINSPLLQDEFIDFKKKAVVRQDGSKENIEIPEILTYDDYNKIEVLTENVTPKIEITYRNYTIYEI